MEDTSQDSISESRKDTETFKVVTRLAEAITDRWPQKLPSEKIAYIFGGSMGVNLIALSTRCVNQEGIPFTTTGKSKLQEYIRTVNDIDIVPFSPLDSPDVLMISASGADEIGKLTQLGELKIDNIYPIRPLPYLKTTLNSRDYFTVSFDVIAASKLLSCLTKFREKPQILNWETPRQISLAESIYGKDHIWQLVQQSYQDELDLGITSPDWMTVTYQVRGLLESNDISDELKELVTQAAAAVRIL